MLKIFLQCDALLNEIYKFSDKVLHLGSSIEDDQLNLFEQQIDYSIPLDFKYILKKHNGISLDGTEILGLDKKLRGSSLGEVYNFEHLASGYKMPKEFLPFSPDGKGNHYCLNLKKM